MKLSNLMPWKSNELQMRINVDENIDLEQIAAHHAAGLYTVIEANRAHFAEFLAWGENARSIENFLNYIKNCELQYQQGNEINFVILLQGIPVGKMGLHYINTQNKCAEIGYWLSKSEEGKGIVTKSCKALINYGFEALGLNRIEILAAEDNVRSLAIPKRLNFTKEGVLRQAELVNDHFLNLVLYSILREEWKS